MYCHCSNYLSIITIILIETNWCGAIGETESERTWSAEVSDLTDGAPGNEKEVSLDTSLSYWNFVFLIC